MEQQKKLTNFVEVIRQIRFKPAMYLGDKKISTMSQFIGGYTFAILIHKLGEQEPVARNFMWFHQFVAIHLGKSDAFGWPGIIVEHCNGDEEKALDLFFELFEEYVKENYTGFN